MSSRAWRKDHQDSGRATAACEEPPLAFSKQDKQEKKPPQGLLSLRERAGRTAAEAKVGGRWWSWQKKFRPPDQRRRCRPHHESAPWSTFISRRFTWKMAHCERASKPLLQCLRTTSTKGLPGLPLQSTRAFQSSAVAHEQAQTETSSQPFHKAPDPALVSSPRLERRLMRQGLTPVGSRRRRAALQDAPNLPFEQLPYQCFQEARKVLQTDRVEKLEGIKKMKEKIARLEALSPEQAGGKQVQRSRLGGMKVHLENLMIQADINDPMVKKRFEDGNGTLSLSSTFFSCLVVRY